MLTQEDSILNIQGSHYINFMGPEDGKWLKVKANKLKKKEAPAKVP